MCKSNISSLLSKRHKLLKLPFGSKDEILNLPNLCLLLFVLQCFSFRLSFFISKLYARNNTFKSSRKIKYSNIDKSIQLILLNVMEKLDTLISVKLYN